MKRWLEEKEEKELLSLVSELVGIPSSIKDGDRIYRFAERYLEKKGFEVIPQGIKSPYIDYSGYNNVYVKFGNGKGPKIVLNGHLDTVDKSNGWYYDPYSAEVVDGNMYGLGAADMKGGVACAIQSLVTLRDRLGDIDGEIFLSLVYGEEAPFSLGTDALLREYDLSGYNLIIVTEPSPVVTRHDYCMTHKKYHNARFPVIIIGAEGRVLFEVDVYGKCSHASHPSQGINALHDASRIVTELSRFDLFSNIKMGRGHYCVINMEGGDQSFTVPSHCKLFVNRQLTLGEDAKSAMKEIKMLIKAMKLKSRISVQKRYSPAPELEYKPYICEKGEYLDLFKEMIPVPPYGRVGKKGYRKCLFTTSSVGDFNLFGTRTDVPTVVFGPGGGNIHSPNEYVNVDEMIETTNHLLNFLMEVYS